MKEEKRFSTLSGLTRHLEPGACQGGLATFKKAIKHVKKQLEVLGFARVKLSFDKGDQFAEDSW